MFNIQRRKHFIFGSFFATPSFYVIWALISISSFLFAYVHSLNSNSFQFYARSLGFDVFLNHVERPFASLRFSFSRVCFKEPSSPEDTPTQRHTTKKRFRRENDSDSRPFSSIILIRRFGFSFLSEIPIRGFARNERDASFLSHDAEFWSKCLKISRSFVRNPTNNLA